MTLVTWSQYSHYCNHCSRVRRGEERGGEGREGREGRGGRIEQREGVRDREFITLQTEHRGEEKEINRNRGGGGRTQQLTPTEFLQLTRKMYVSPGARCESVCVRREGEEGVWLSLNA